jgi:hypothetical protein
MTFTNFLCLIPLLLYLTNSVSAIQTITRDVVVIGGGVAGTYTAVRLGDFQKSVVIVEQKETLGGATKTYHDPVTGQTIDSGVQLFQNLDIVKNFYARFDLPLANVSFGLSGAGGGLIPVDFRTGKLLNISALPSAVAGAFAKYSAQLARFPFLTEPGIQLPDPVPDDLLLPFGQFAEKFGVQDIVQLIALEAEGFGNVTEATTLYIFKFFNQIVLDNLASHFLTSATTNNHELYEKAYDQLGANNVLLNSTIVSIDRPVKSDPDAVIRLIVRSASSGETVKIKAKQIVFAIPPVSSNLKQVDLDATEGELISRFTSRTFVAGVLKNDVYPQSPGILYNSDLSTPFNLPILPSIYYVGPVFTPSNLTVFTYGTPFPPERNSDEEMKEHILSLVKTTIPTSNPEIVSFVSPGPYECQVSPGDIRSGFYRRLNALEGHRNTWWTGAAWQHPDVALIWNFTEAVVIPGLIKNLQG